MAETVDEESVPRGRFRQGSFLADHRKSSNGDVDSPGTCTRVSFSSTGPSLLLLLAVAHCHRANGTAARWLGGLQTQACGQVQVFTKGGESGGVAVERQGSRMATGHERRDHETRE